MSPVHLDAKVRATTKLERALTTKLERALLKTDPPPSHRIWHKLYTDMVWTRNFIPKNIVNVGLFLDRTM